jgi:outer membrane receptor protein involved in Fe transport
MRTIIGSFLLLLTLVVQAQEKSKFIKGRIIDSATLLPVDGAAIKSHASGEVVLSDERGQFILRKAAIDGDTFEITAVGYVASSLTENDISVKRIIELKSRPLLLKDVMIFSAYQDPNYSISRFDSKLKPIHNATEILQMVPGLFIGQHAGGGKAEQIFLRGFDVDHGTDVNLSVDGIPVNMVSHAHGQGYADMHFLIPELVEKVSFQKGPYDAGNGNFATAGSVDVRTKSHLKNNTIKSEAGLYGHFRNVILLNLLKDNKKERNWFAAGEYLFNRGYFDHPQNLNRLNLFTRYNRKIGQNHTATITGSYFKSRWNASGQIPERSVANGDIGFYGAIDPTEGGKTSRMNASILSILDLPGNGQLRNLFYYTFYDFNLFSNFTFFLNDPQRGDQIRQKEWRQIIGYNSSYHKVHFFGQRKFTTEAGAGFRYDKTKGSELSRTFQRTTTLQQLQSGNIKELNTSAYAEGTLKWNQRFSTRVGLRLDHFAMRYDDLLNASNPKSSAFIASPKLNLMYQLSARAELYFLSGKGFHSNDARVTVQGQREALPAAFGNDLGVNIKASEKLLICAALWRLDLEQEFVYVGDEGIVEPAGRTRRKGFDLSTRWQLSRQLFMEGNLNYAHARLKDATRGENFIPLAPSLTSSGSIIFKSGGWNANCKYRYMGHRPANETNTLTAKGYMITDLFFGWSGPRLEYNLTVLNLFNRKWKETQFETESRLKDELFPVKEIHFTPGIPLFLKASFAYTF